MEQFEFIKKACVENLINEVKIDKNKIIATDKTKVLALRTISKKEVFKDVFGLRDLKTFLKLANSFEIFSESEKRLILKNSLQTLEWLKADESIIETKDIEESRLINLETQLKEKGVKIKVDADLKYAINQALELKFSDVVEISNKEDGIYLTVGTKESEHSFKVKLSGDKTKVKLSLVRTILNSVIKNLGDTFNIYLKSDMPLLIEEESNLAKTQYFIAPVVESEIEVVKQEEEPSENNEGEE